MHRGSLPAAVRLTRSKSSFPFVARLCFPVARSGKARQMLSAARAEVPAAAEALGIVVVEGNPRRTLLACGHDARGLVYALTELADLVRNAPDPVGALSAVETTIERPANEVR